ncbi:MAG: hypothetical protein K2G30_03420 [Muribaculaceae bacterium]|nr:hypothetical protein [Muribaculaceae bacterium]MDE7142036.1 hypothetical protein [Muribaculaceae bacterium]
MKRIKLLCAVAAIGGLQVSAADSLQLVFRSTNGTEERLEAAGLRIAVDGGSLAVTTMAGTHVFEIAALDGMYFDGPVSAIETVREAAGNQPVAVYAVDGTPRGSYPTLDDAVRELNAGVYVVAQPGKSFKIQVR